MAALTQNCEQKKNPHFTNQIKVKRLSKLFAITYLAHVVIEICYKADLHSNLFLLTSEKNKNKNKILRQISRFYLYSWHTIKIINSMKGMQWVGIHFCIIFSFSRPSSHIGLFTSHFSFIQMPTYNEIGNNAVHRRHECQDIQRESE